MDLTIATSRHSGKSAVELAKALDACAFNVYTREVLHGTYNPEHPVYNMGVSHTLNNTTFNDASQIAVCVDKLATFNVLKSNHATIVPFTRHRDTAQGWLNTDRIVVNRATLTGKSNEGLSYSYKALPDVPDTPLSDSAILWTRYVNHTNEYRVLAIQHNEPLVFRKVESDGTWTFRKHVPSVKFKQEILKAQQAFNKMFVVGFDVLECVTGDYYFLEANSAPSLLAHHSILPTVADAVRNYRA